MSAHRHPSGTTEQERISGVSETRGGETVAREEEEPGHRPAEPRGARRPSKRATARRATGINPRAEDPIDPRMPPLFPA